MGKHKPTYVPHVDCGDYVVVINAKDVKFTGNKGKQKLYRWHTGHPGGLKELTARHLYERGPDRIITSAVKGMLPKNRMRDHRLRRLRVYGDASGAEEHHANIVGSARMAPEFMAMTAPDAWAMPPGKEGGDLVRDYFPESLVERLGAEAVASAKSYDDLMAMGYDASPDDVEVVQDEAYLAEMRALFERLSAEAEAEAAGADGEGEGESKS